MKKYELSGFEVWEYEELVSTNTQAAEIPKSELKDRQVILTYCQTQGRGQVGNKWESEPGKNLSMSVILRPERYDAGRQFAVSMVIALGCCDFVSHYVKDCTVKWPNDVYVGDKKISGILIEHIISGAYIRHSICGIGVNINQCEFRSDAPNPVSLFQLTGRELVLTEALGELLDCIGKRYEQIGHYKQLEQDYLAVMYRRNGVYGWSDEKGLFMASVKGVDEYGRLVLTDAKGEERVYGFKEVVFQK